jgi:small subunit ribosomal protein S3
MGQKVNPISMRLQVNKDWRSKWFANKKEYASLLGFKTFLCVRMIH